MLLAAAAAVVVLFSPLADVERVEIVGLHRLTLDEVEGKLNFSPGVALVSLDFAAAQAALEDLVWFSDATFERSLNGVITVRISEQRPVLIASATSTWVVISHEGRVLSEPLTTPPPLPQIVNTQATAASSSFTLGGYLPADFLPLLDIADAAEQAQVAITQLGRDDRNEIRLLLASGDQVAVGDDSQLAAKLAALIALLDELDRRSDTPTVTGALEIDVSVPHLPVVRDMTDPLAATAGRS